MTVDIVFPGGAGAGASSSASAVAAAAATVLSIELLLLKLLIKSTELLLRLITIRCASSNTGDVIVE